WSQVAAVSYRPFLRISDEIWKAKKASLRKNDTHRIRLSPSYTVDAPVPAMSVCETKYVMAEYVAQGIRFGKAGGLGPYLEGLEKFEERFCTRSDKDHYYNYRGDSNFKPYSPAS